MPDTLSSPNPTAANHWPEGGLEPVPACPICGSQTRELAHRGLRDRIFGCAPGEWTMQRCTTCGTGYLDPRPNAATIGLAYSSYFTHSSAVEVEQPPRSAWRRHRLAQRNAYLNASYGYQLAPAAGGVPWWLGTDRRQRWDKYCGYLRFPGKGARLLDIGCGNGRFLMQMRSLGWDVAGVETDPKSAAQAVATGLAVKVGMLEAGTYPEANFAAVTLNHVIEHLHDPMQTLRLCHRVLKPGGTIYIATPNFASAGHELFGPNWFPLDPPRHLVLFTPDSLRRALKAAGFEPEPSNRPRFIANEVFTHSLRLRRGGEGADQPPSLPPLERLRTAWLARRADAATRTDPRHAEELVQLARRP